MVLSNAERQARFRERLKAKVGAGVTPDDVRRAVRMCFEAWQAESGETLSFDDWHAGLKKGEKGNSAWREFAPHSDDPEDYWEHLSAEDRDFLAKVGAVALAVLKPPVS